MSLTIFPATSYSPTTRCGSTIAAGELNCCVRYGNRCGLSAFVTRKYENLWFCSSPWSFRRKLQTASDSLSKLFFAKARLSEDEPSKLHNVLSLKSRSSPRTISTSQLKALLPLHIWPIYLIIYKGSYQLNAVGDLILRLASRLDAFSAYPVRTW